MNSATQRRYKITCLKCNESDIVTIDETNKQVWDFEKKILTNILAMRWRRDLQWGVECRCGNDNRLAASEEKDFKDIVFGDGMSIKKIADSLKIPDKKQFEMSPV